MDRDLSSGYVAFFFQPVQFEQLGLGSCLLTSPLASKEKKTFSLSFGQAALTFFLSTDPGKKGSNVFCYGAIRFPVT